MNLNKFTQLIRGALCLALIGITIIPPLKAKGSSLPEQERPLIEVLDEFSETYQIFFSYDSKSLNSISVEFHLKQNEQMESAIARLLTPLGLAYESFGQKYYVIYKQNKQGQRNARKVKKHLKKIQKLESRGDLSIQSSHKRRSDQIRSIVNTVQEIKKRVQIKGTVVDAKSEPLIGVNILVKGSNTGTITDFNGEFTLNVEDANATLVVSYIGYESIEVPLEGRTTLEIVMTTASTALDEVVVIGYGTSDRKDLTGAVGSVKEEDLTVFPTANVSQAIQGRVTGVQVASSNPVPGENPRIIIRGVNSPSSDSQPLFVVDGFVGAPVPPAEDIASVEILKDAATAAIYGSQGSNGVVLITTKSGKTGELRVDFNSSYSFQNVINELDLMNRNQWEDLQREINPAFTSIDPTGQIDTDWQDLLFERATIFNNQLSLSGGSDNVKYYVSGTYFDQDGIVISSDFDRMSLNGNIDVNVSEKVRFRTSVFTQRTRSNGVISQEGSGGVTLQGAISAAYLFAPDQGVFTEDGEFTVHQAGSGFNNPVAIASARQDERTVDNTQINFKGDWDILDGLTLTSTFGYRVGNSFRGRFIPSTLVAGGDGDAEINTERSTNFLTETYLTFRRLFNNVHRLKLTAGSSYQDLNRFTVGTGATVFTTNAFGFWNLSGGEVPDIPSSFLDPGRELFGVYGRFEYSYDSRYVINGVFRRDGSSVLSENERYKFYPSVGFAWNVDREAFMSDVTSISSLKLLASYGLVANQSIAPGSTQSLLRGIFYSNNQNAPVVGLVPGQIPNTDLGWETTAQFNIGIDAGLFDNAIQFNLNYYKKNTTDLLFAVPLNPLVGVQGGVQIRNIGEVENRGIELGLGYNKSFGEFNWSTDFNISRNINEVISLPNGDDIFYTRVPVHIEGLSDNSQNLLLREGQPIGVFFGYQSNGLYQEGDELLPGPVTAAPGEERFNDLASRDETGRVVFSPDGVIDEADRTIIGDPTPDFVFGFNNDFRFKGFDLNIFFQGQVGGDIYNFTRLELENPAGGDNRLATVSNRWTPANTNTDIPRAAATRQNFFSDRFVEDGTFIRLKNIALGYTLNNNLLNKIGLQRLRAYVSGQNLLTITNYSGLDPEVSYLGNSSVSGLDYGSYPNFRSVTIGVNATF